MANETSNQPIRAAGGWSLVYKHDGSPVHVGDRVATSSRDYTAIVTGGRPPGHSFSSGRVYVSTTDEPSHDEYFPHCFDLKWQKA